MARDEALLECGAEDDARPVLRFYAWSLPTISLGYFQDYSAYEELPDPAGGLAVVRRTTGGGAILHDLEVTYSLTLPADHSLVRGRPNRLYGLAHEAVIHAIGEGVRMMGDDCGGCDASSRRGPFFCFARRHGYDVVIDAAQVPGGVSKIAGSAQRRTRRAILQHGSIILDSRYDQQPTATWSSLVGAIDFDAAVVRLIPAFEAALELSVVGCEWRLQELEAARRIESKYAGRAWTRGRDRVAEM